MVDILILTLLALTSVYYCFFLARVQLGIARLLRSHQLQRFPYVSVVIAVRNEEITIEQCLDSVVNQHYPADRFEVIVVDDHSTDSTPHILKKLTKRHKQLKVFSLLLSEERGKTAALAKGIEEAKGEIIFTTDADCKVLPTWLITMVHHFTEDTVMVAGPVLHSQRNNSIIEEFDRLELLGLITVAAGLIGSKRPIICNGANLAYRRDAFYLAGGFGKTSTNNDDELLMNRFVTRKLGSIDFAWEHTAIVFTEPAQSIKSFLKQRMRWASKKGHYEDRTILIELVILYFFFLSLLMNILLGLLYDSLFLLPFLVAFCGKILLDYLTLRIGAQLWNQKIKPLIFFLAELCHVPYILVEAFLGQLMPIRWKDN